MKEEIISQDRVRIESRPAGPGHPAAVSSGKQESTTLFFRKGETGQALKEGMVSAIEYQWPYQGYALGIEDMFVVGPHYGINISR